jgi:hypothetical protein
MTTSNKEPLPGTSITPEQILAVCRTNVEAMHNLAFLMKEHISDPEALANHFRSLDGHLLNMTNELCRKL